MSDPRFSCCKFFKVLCSLLLLFNTGALRPQPLSPPQVFLERLQFDQLSWQLTAVLRLLNFVAEDVYRAVTTGN